MGAGVNEVTGRLLRKGDYIFGSFVKPEAVDGYINGVNPAARGDVLGRFPFSEASVDDAVEFAGVGYRVWRRMTINDRAGAVHRFREQMSEHQETISRLITRETGKPLWESRQELLATLRALDLLLDEGVGMLAPRIIDDIGARSDRLPRGVAAIFCPFNFPLMVAAIQCATAVLAGNTVVVKPSKFTPGVGQAHVELWDRCRLPRGVVNMVQGPGSVVGQRLATHPDIDVLLFTGSLDTARTIRRLTQSRPELPTLMQCGGKGAAIVLEGAEMDRAVYEVMVGSFLTAGQRHNSTGRVILTEAVYDEFVERIVHQTKQIKVGDGFEPHVFLGPLISENLRTRFRRFTRTLAGKGHEMLLEPETPEGVGNGFFVRPSIVHINWSSGSTVLDIEPPGPMLLVYKVPDWQQAVALHNQIDARISTSIFVDPDDPNLRDIRDRLRTGALNINRGTIGASLRLPSVGLGTSSNGINGGVELLKFLSHPRSQLTEVRRFETLPKLPGINWADESPMTVTAEEALPLLDEPTEVGDLSSYLELATD
jgi:succinylglutamic semialdehyde dehydrogenase